MEEKQGTLGIDPRLINDHVSIEPTKPLPNATLEPYREERQPSPRFPSPEVSMSPVAGGLEIFPFTFRATRDPTATNSHNLSNPSRADLFSVLPRNSVPLSPLSDVTSLPPDSRASSPAYTAFDRPQDDDEYIEKPATKKRVARKSGSNTKNIMMKPTFEEDEADLQKLVDEASSGPSGILCPLGCKHRTKNRGDMRRHLKSSQHREPSYACRYCGSMFTREDACVRHEKKRCTEKNKKRKFDNA